VIVKKMGEVPPFIGRSPALLLHNHFPFCISNGQHPQVTIAFFGHFAILMATCLQGTEKEPILAQQTQLI
jgi:hypothetical protein